MKNSLIVKFIYASENYQELCKSFYLIAEINNKNFSTLLLIIIDHYNKINANELLDCFTYSSNFRNRVFLSMLELINLNFDKILNIFRNENKSVNIENYITQNIQN